MYVEHVNTMANVYESAQQSSNFIIDLGIEVATFDTSVRYIL